MGGLDPLIDIIRTDYIQPVASLLFPDYVGTGLDSHKVFTVEYSADVGADIQLATHFDNCEVTLNVCLSSDEHEGGELCFGEGPHSLPVQHRVGRGVLHLGKEVHSAMPMESGARSNLIMWMRASSVRNMWCPMCGEKPSLEMVEHGRGDGFTMT